MMNPEINIYKNKLGLNLLYQFILSFLSVSSQIKLKTIFGKIKKKLKFETQNYEYKNYHYMLLSLTK